MKTYMIRVCIAIIVFVFLLSFVILIVANSILSDIEILKFINK